MCDCDEEFSNCYRTTFGIILKQQRHKRATKFWKKRKEQYEMSDRSCFINMEEIKHEIVLGNFSKIEHDNTN